MRPSSMQLPILPAGAQSIADDPPALRALCICFGVLLAILPLAHVTALRNVLIGLIAVLALLHFRLAPWKNIPGLIPWLVWLAFAAASIGWSALPDASFQSFRSDQFYPFVIFLVSFLVVRFLGGRLAVAIGTAAGTLLCLATMFAAAMLGVDPDATAPEPGVLGWLAWKAGNVTDSSTYVAFIAVPLFLILVTSRHAWRRSAAAVWLLLFAAIGFLSESRTLVATLFVSFVGFLIALGILRGRLHWKSVLLVVGIGVTVSAACIEVISRARLPALSPGSRSAAVEMIMSDPRPAIWAAYFELARTRPWLGIGLGRTVPSRAYRLHDDADLRRIDSQAASHAHNVILDLVLQVGVIGLVFWLWLHAEILRLAWQRARQGGDREKAWAAAAVALVLAMLVKNSTNDLTVYGNAILFWSLMGTMLGLIWCGVRAVGEAVLSADPVPG
ncbi:MAG TPA: O-antigen ligase family protein [Casimicrobiaceae bacterium]|nr:O-antigen ligase family protein [Casimicrobiaceae bacterium]